VGTDPASLAAAASSVTAVVHVAHAGLVIGGAATVLAMLSPLAMRRRRAALAELRFAAATGNLVRLAELRAAGHDHRHHVTDRARPALVVAIMGSLAAAGVHAAVCPAHFHEAFRFGIFFLALSTWQVVWSVLAVRRPSSGLFAAGILTSLTTVTLWVVTRTVGLPFGLAEVEPVGAPDLLASIAEVATVVGLLRCTGVVERLTIGLSGRSA